MSSSASLLPPTHVIELEFLTPDESLRDLCRKYWELGGDGEFAHSVKSVAEGLQVSSSRVAARITELCLAWNPNEACPECGVRSFFTSRANYAKRAEMSFRAPTMCTMCRKEQEDEKRQAEEQRAKRRMDLIAMDLDRVRARGMDVADFSLADAVYLLGLVRAGASEDLTYILPHHAFNEQLSPTPELDRQILDHLYRRSRICIHPGSKPDTVVIENDKFASFFPMQVHWIIPTSAEGPSTAKFLEDLEAAVRSEAWPQSWEDEAPRLQRTIALHECLQYLSVVLEAHEFDFNPGDKTRLVIESALQSFSVGQVFSFIWRAAKDAAAFYIREATSRTHAVNIVPGAIQRMSERALSEGWQVKPFRRDFRAPESKVSQVLLTVALGLPEDGLQSVVPSAPLETEDESE